MATYTVTTAADVMNAGDGVLSSREAVQQANAAGAGDTIQFANVLEGQTLTLTQGQLTLASDMSIDGDTDKNVTKSIQSGWATDPSLRCGGIAGRAPRSQMWVRKA